MSKYQEKADRCRKSASENVLIAFADFVLAGVLLVLTWGDTAAFIAPPLIAMVGVGHLFLARWNRRIADRWEVLGL